MSKKWVLSFVFGLLLIVVYYFLGSLLQKQIQPLSSNVRLLYLNITEYFGDTVDKHYSQAEMIASLKTQNEKLQKDALAYKNAIKETGYKQNVSSFAVLDANQSVKIKLSRVLSYSNLPNLYRLWIDFEPSKENDNNITTPKIYGVIYPTKNKLDSVACGIAVKGQNSAYEVFLNGDSRCSYGVYIGKSKAPGIVYGKNQDKLIVKYIPTWMEVNPGDEVLTSGLDNIFFEGVLVGVVKSVSSNSAYKEALVQGYYNPLSPNYFYVIERAK